MAEQEKRIYLGHGRYVKLVIGGKKNGADEHGKTHSIWLDTFKPDKTKRQQPGEENAQPRRSSEEESAGVGVDDIPF